MAHFELPVTTVAGDFEVLFEAGLTRTGGDWASDAYGAEVLEQQTVGLRRTGKTLTVAPWPVVELPTRTVAEIRRATGTT